MQDLLTEAESIKQFSQKSVNELQGLFEFFKIFTKTYKEEVDSFDKRLTEHQEKYKYINDSILSANLIGIYECFDQYNKTTQSLMTKINNELISPLEFFRKNQFKIYQENIDELREINKYHQPDKDMLNYFRQNYYQASDMVQRESQRRRSFFTEAKDNYDTIIKNKMRAKNMEMIYKYEIERYNNYLPEINEKYEKIQEKIRIADKSRIMFIKTSFDKFRNYMGEYIKNIQDFLQIIENYISDDICGKDEKHTLAELNKFKKENQRIHKQNFISFKQYVENEKLTKNNKPIFNFVLVPSGTILGDKMNNLEEKDITDFIKDLVDNLINENEVSGIKISKLIELFQFKNPNSELEKKFLDTIIEKRKISSIRFYNLKNLEHLANILSYITFKEESIFVDKFELNFKIIYIAEKIFYQNKINNNKVYLSAILSKNKYYRTKTFWKNVMELKLANKLQDHMIRIKNYILPEEKNSTIFKKLKIQIKDSHKTSLIGKSHIVSLLKDYNNLEPTRIEIMDKMAIQEMTGIVKNTIPNFSNFNVPSDICQDLVVEMVQEYKVPNDNINYCITFSNVSSHTIRRLLPHEKDTFENNVVKQGGGDKNNTEKNSKRIKILEKVIPFLSKKDYIKLLLISKYYNKKIKKKIYKYILKQPDVKKEIRLNIWSNLLQIPKIKKEYNYREILTKTNDEKAKYEIKIDIDRTAVNPDNVELHRKILSDILYAVSQSNGEIKYCQGMNFIACVLYEIFGEEEAFYIFLSFFKNTDYPLIFAKDLQKLKVFFYVFNRIIQLYEPELSSFLNTRNATAITFLPPWFITLFQSSHQYIRDNINVMVRILDAFVTSGWKGLMIVGIALLHNFENTLMNKKYEAMMEFLINDILKSDFFRKENIDKFEEYFETVKINKNLIKNIELENIQDEKLNDANKG